MKLKTLLLPFAALALCTNAFAATPSDASLEKWMEVQHFDKEIKQSFKAGFSASLQPFVSKMIAALPPEKQVQVNEAWTRYLDGIKEGVLTPELMAKLRNDFKDSAKTYFTQEEVNALIAFYSSHAGKSIMDKLPEFMSKTNQQMMQNMPKVAELEAIHKRHETEFMKEIHQIICDGKNTTEICKKQPGKNTRRK